MAQNISTAVMARRKEPHDSLDFFPTPPWATRALLEQLQSRPLTSRHVLPEMSAIDPACGEGHMVRPLREFFGTVRASDVHDYGWGHQVSDFLWPVWDSDADWIITNPPFRLGQEFAERALDRAQVGVAFFVRTAFLEGWQRYQELYQPHPPTLILQFAQRVSLCKGRYDPQSETATAYCWIIWLKNKRSDDPAFGWIPQCKHRLMRPEDVEPIEEPA